MPVDPAKSIAQAWRKSRLAARILRRQDRGQLTPATSGLAVSSAKTPP